MDTNQLTPEQIWERTSFGCKAFSWLLAFASLGVGLQLTIDTWQAGQWVLFPFAVALFLFGAVILIGLVLIVFDL